MKIFKFLLITAFILAPHAFAGIAHNYKYNDLILLNYDDMNKQVQHRIQQSRKDAKAASKNKDGDDAEADHAAVDQLEDALKFIFSRPNSDNMVAKLTPDVRRELADMSAYEDTLSGLATEELGIANDKNANTIQRSTALFVLENLLSEIKPEAGSNKELRRIVQKIADADLDIAHDVVNDRTVRIMYKTENPSDLAKKILKKLPKEEKK